MKFILSSLALSLGACAFTPHEVSLNASVPIIKSNVGGDSTIALRVYDDRDSKTVGQRGVAMMGADITASDVISYIDTTVEQWLGSKNFNVVDYSENDVDSKLTVSLRAFKFFIESGFFTGANNVSVVLKVEGKNGSDNYIKSYNFDSETRILFVPDGLGIDSALNVALTDVMTQMMFDEQLIDFLAGRR